MARDWAAGPGLILLCGRFEGLDERLIEARNMQEVAVGEAVLAGGEAAALVLLEACVRLIPGVLGNEHSIVEESFSDGLLEHPQYTRPREWEGRALPDVLTSAITPRSKHGAKPNANASRASAIVTARRGSPHPGAPRSRAAPTPAAPCLETTASP